MIDRSSRALHQSLGILTSRGLGPGEIHADQRDETVARHVSTGTVLTPPVFSSVRIILVAIVALVPGIAAWWTGRRYRRAKQRPVPPGVAFAGANGSLTITTTAFVATAFLGGRHAYWGVLLITVSTIVGSYPLRRALGTETDGLPRNISGEAQNPSSADWDSGFSS